jgi:hypothetical protein
MVSGRRCLVMRVVLVCEPMSCINSKFTRLQFGVYIPYTLLSFLDDPEVINARFDGIFCSL